MEERTYIAIDLKSFYASVECVARGLDPLKTHLVVADPNRTEKTICLAVSPSLKAYGIPGRARLFEVVEKVKQVNARRLMGAPNRRFDGKSSDADALRVSPELALDYIVAPPQMAHYMQVSAQVYQIYLRYVSPEDICVYSVDEVFIDVTGYLATYRVTARQLAAQMIEAVLSETGITGDGGHRHKPLSEQGCDGCLLPSTWSRTRTGCALPNWVRGSIESSCGIIGRLRISGGRMRHSQAIGV